MATYTNVELLNELSLIFRARVTTSKTGGNLNTREEYEQLLGLATLTFLFNSDSIFYVGQLADNQLRSLLRQEVALVEDMLVEIDDLIQRGVPVKDTTTLSNAKTTVLALDAAQSIAGRPETERFNRQMAAYSSQFYNNVVSRRTSGFVYPKEEARTLLKTNLVNLQLLHERLLPRITALRDLLTKFNELDLPSVASTSALAGVRKNLDDMTAFTESATDAQNLEAGRRTLLKALANKTAVNLISSFSDPSEVKYRSPVSPIPTGLVHLGRAVGSTTIINQGGLSGSVGSAAQIQTAPGPWLAPITAPVAVAFNGESSVSVPIDQVRGPAIFGRYEEPFVLDSLTNRLCVVLDPTTYTGTASGSHGTTSAVFAPASGTSWRLGFKHVGAPLLFAGDRGVPSNEYKPRVLTDITAKQAGNVSSYTPATGVLVATTSIFNASMVGGYVKNGGGEKREIVSYVSGNTVVLDDFNAAFSLPGASAFTAHAVYSGDTSISLSWTPALATSTSVNTTVQIGQASKYASLPLGTSTLSQVIAAINTETDANMPWWSLCRYVRATATPSDGSKLTLELRGRWNRFLQVVDSFYKPSLPGVGSAVTLATTAYKALGFVLGERLDPRYSLNDFVSATTVADAITEFGLAHSGMASVVESTVVEGTAYVGSGTYYVNDLLGRNLESLGVLAGDTLELLDGLVPGRYQISTIAGPQLTIRMSSTFPVGEQGLRYRIIRESVLIYSLLVSSRSSVQIVSAPAELGLAVGTTYGTLKAFEAVNQRGEQLDFKKAAPGDLLRLLGSSEQYPVASVLDSVLYLETGVPSNLANAGFELTASSARQYNALKARLDTYLSSGSLLQKNRYDENLDALAYAVVAALLPGQNFESSRNQAKRLLTDLLSVLTSNPLRSAEYSASVPTAADNLESILNSYSVSRVKPVDDLLDAFNDRKYERAAELLSSGRVDEFFATNDETGSYAGAMMSASRRVVRDLPNTPNTEAEVSDDNNLATSVQTGENPETNFSDTEGDQLVE